MDQAKELTAPSGGPCGASAESSRYRMLKIPTAGLDEERFEGKLDELLELINSTQETWKAYAVAAASEEHHGGGTGAGLRYSYTYIDKLIERIKELRVVLK